MYDKDGNFEWFGRKDRTIVITSQREPKHAMRVAEQHVFGKQMHKNQCIKNGSTSLGEEFDERKAKIIRHMEIGCNFRVQTRK